VARTESTMTKLGTAAPPFDLPDPDGRRHALSDFEGCPALLVAFICNHCPYVKHIADAFAGFAKRRQADGLAVVAINANDIEQVPADAPPAMKAEAEARGYSFPYLFDASQEVARAYGAACTPDFFLFDGERKLAYRGRFDASRPGNDAPVNGADLEAAVDAVLAGRPAPGEQWPSLGCNIKWKPASEATGSGS